MFHNIPFQCLFICLDLPDTTTSLWRDFSVWKTVFIKVFALQFVKQIRYACISTILNNSTVDLHLSGSSWPLGWICREFYKTNLPWNYRLSDHVQYGTVLWLLEVKIKDGQEVYMQVPTANSQTTNCHCSLYSKKNLIIRNFLHIRGARRPN
jgi:hypothetical protein